MNTSLQQYRRLGALGYARWVCQANGVEFTEDMISLMDNHAIHAHVESLLTPVEDTPAPLLNEEPINPFNEDLLQYDSLTVAELRALCKERGLPVYGTKAQIVLRLKQNDEGIIPEEEPESPVVETALEGDSEAPTEEVAASIGEEINEQTNDSDEQEPVIEE
jgi:hypothetical protein